MGGTSLRALSIIAVELRDMAAGREERGGDKLRTGAFYCRQGPNG